MRMPTGASPPRATKRIVKFDAFEQSRKSRLIYIIKPSKHEFNLRAFKSTKAPKQPVPFFRNEPCTRA
jgi:hypothetical protein